MLDAGYSMLYAGYSMLDTGFSILDLISPQSAPFDYAQDRQRSLRKTLTTKFHEKTLII